ncbi:hypothetical protein PC121_g11781 [Phytophthora cactorum]|nr:hypothetical protein PC120_g10310 [Phytophthora cactorum]KAG3064301.1 hypothetical protein PC121_g11781 [Phytophthora cactorum]KAG4059387.1 hypothetical protein PC123_g5699 [Phytophthora cactorum]
MIRTWVIQLLQPNNAAALVRVTPLKPIKLNATRWSLTFTVLEHYVRIRDAVLTISAVEEHVPRGNAHRRIASAVEKSMELDSVCVKLQAEKCFMADVRVLFDTCAAKYPVMADYLSPSADIIHSLEFEMAIVKFQNDLPMLSSEQHSPEGFVVEPSEPTPGPRARVDFASTILRLAKNNAVEVSSRRRTTSCCTSHSRRATHASVYSPSANWR